MRVIAGTAGGIKLEVPKTLLRPSTDRLREALFSILAPRIMGARVLDLFAGSGALGIEALSRGAREAHFVESDHRAVATIKANLAKTRLGEPASCRRQDVFAALAGLDHSFDLIFADPPYVKQADDTNYGQKLLLSPAFPALLAPGGLFILEREAAKLPDVPQPWKLTRERRYGNSQLLFFEKAGRAASGE